MFQFKRSSIPHILGFKLQYYAHTEYGKPMNAVTPRSLLLLAALLIAHDMVTLVEVRVPRMPAYCLPRRGVPHSLTCSSCCCYCCCCCTM